MQYGLNFASKAKKTTKLSAPTVQISPNFLCLGCTLCLRDALTSFPCKFGPIFSPPWEGARAPSAPPGYTYDASPGRQQMAIVLCGVSIEYLSSSHLPHAMSHSQPKGAQRGKLRIKIQKKFNVDVARK